MMRLFLHKHPTLKSSIVQNLKIVNDETIFVRSKGAEAEHTQGYVSIPLSADSCKKNSSERFLYLFA